MAHLGGFGLYDSVRVSHWRPWDRVRRVIVGDTVAGELRASWTRRATDSFGGIDYTRETLVELTSDERWEIMTEVPTPLPKRKVVGFTTQPKRPISDRRVLVHKLNPRETISVFYEASGTRFLELPDKQRFTIGGRYWSFRPVPILAETGQLVATAKRKWYLWDGYDEFRLGTSIPLQLVLLAWHVLSGDHKMERSSD